MKRTQATAFGPPRSAFAPARPRQEATPRLNEGRPPLLGPHVRRVPVHIVWQAPAEPVQIPVPAAGPLPRENRNTSSQREAVLAAGGTLLRTAIASGRQELVATLLRRPDAAEMASTVNSEGFNALCHAISRRDAECARRLLVLPSGNAQAMQGAGTLGAPLLLAAHAGAVEIVQMLLEMASAREQVAAALAAGNSPLVHAANAGQPQVVALLLASAFGAQLAASAGSKGISALTAAAYRGHAEVVRILLGSVHHQALAAGVDPEGADALLRAAQRGHAEVVQLLLDSPHGRWMAGRVTPAGYDALYLAARMGHQDVVRILLQSPGYLEGRRAGGACRDPHAAAVIHGHVSIARLLQAHGFGSAAGPTAGPGSGSYK